MPFSGILRVTVRLALSFGHWFVIQLHTNRINSSVSVHTYRMEYVRIKWNVQICHFVCTSNYYLNERVRTYCNVIDFVYVEYAERERESILCMLFDRLSDVISFLFVHFWYVYIFSVGILYAHCLSCVPSAEREICCDRRWRERAYEFNGKCERDTNNHHWLVTFS